jgi:hypothetical protein
MGRNDRADRGRGRRNRDTSSMTPVEADAVVDSGSPPSATDRECDSAREEHRNEK